MKLTIYSARWCMPCHAMEPILEAFEAAHQADPGFEIEKLDIEKLNESQLERVEDLKIQHVPTFVFGVGEEPEILIGVQGWKDLEDAYSRAVEAEHKAAEVVQGLSCTLLVVRDPDPARPGRNASGCPRLSDALRVQGFEVIEVADPKTAALVLDLVRHLAPAAAIPPQARKPVRRARSGKARKAAPRGKRS